MRKDAQFQVDSQTGMAIEHSRYEYRDNRESCAHDYLLPPLFREIRAISRGKSLNIVDLGCGNGSVAAKIAAQGHTVTGIDVSLDGIAIARASFPGVSYHVGSVYDDDLLTKIGGSVDCVVSLEVVEHLFFPKKLFEQSYRLLIDGGALIVSTPYHGYLKNLALSVTNGWDRHFGVDWDGGHIKFFSKTTLAQMASNAGFVNIRFFPVGRFAGLWKAMIMVAEKRNSK
jgi:2-polyprenyl-6-hydroxyphenyl methylase/3-demethylubiquinone-9 3-methyltransferase